MANFLYPGTVGLPSTHPYYTQAVAAHRNMVVGQKVTLRDDIVTTDEDGRHVAYLYLGEKTYTKHLINATIIGDGLGKLGNFAGNNKQRYC